MRTLQLIDALQTGGAERMAISIANGLAQTKGDSFLVATRKEGPLAASIDPLVDYRHLNKKRRIDITFFWRLYSYIKKNKIDIVHAHSTSFFYATLIKILRPQVGLVWHDHYGNSEMIASRRYKILKWASGYFDAILAVNSILENWAKTNLKCDKVYYFRNFVDPTNQVKPIIKLKGSQGKRIVCLANIIRQKDHLVLLKAFKIVNQEFPEFSLHLLGKIYNDDYYGSLKEFIKKNELKDVYFYDAQVGILELLRSCDIGVLSSNSEGLPVALLEYGLAKLPVVVTDVGQCREVVGEYGRVVPSGDQNALAEALLDYIKRPEESRKMAESFSNHINQNYTLESSIANIIKVYKTIGY